MTFDYGATVKKINIDILGNIFLGGEYTCGEARKEIWDKMSLLNFPRQAHTGNVTDCLALFRIFLFLESGFFGDKILI